MSLKTNPKAESEPTSAIERNDVSQNDNMRRVTDKKFELERQTARGAPDLEALEARIASVDIPELRKKTH